MGKPGETLSAEERQREEGAAGQMYATVSRPLNGREVAEQGEDQASVLLDEMALKLMGCGCPSRREAVKYVGAVVAVLQAKDKAVCKAVLGGAADESVRAEEGGFARPEALEAVRTMAIKLVQAQKPRWSAGCLLLAAGFEDHPGVQTQRAWAERQQVSPEHTSNEVQEWQRTMKLPATSAQKSAGAKASYKDSNGRIGKGTTQ